MTPEFEKLLRTVIQKTDEQKLTWERTAAAGKYQAVFPGSIVQIWLSRTPDYSEPDVNVALLDADGTILESIKDTDRDLKGKISFSELDAFYKGVRGQALGVTKAITSALSALDKL